MTRENAIEILKTCRERKLKYTFYTLNEYQAATDMAIKALEQTRWIACSERLPEDGQFVLFCDIDEDIMVGYHVKGRPYTHFSQDGTYEDMKNVRAWMPLPQPYKGESEVPDADSDWYIRG